MHTVYAGSDTCTLLINAPVYTCLQRLVDGVVDPTESLRSRKCFFYPRSSVLFITLHKPSVFTSQFLSFHSSARSG